MKQKINKGKTMQRLVYFLVFFSGSFLVENVADSTELNWAKTFDSQQVATYFDRGGLRIIVVSAGAPQNKAADAAAALEVALRKSGKTKLVMSDDSLESMASLNDKDIVGKCKSLPVDLAATVRVFPGEEEGKDNVVVVFYNLKGKVVVAMNGQANVKLPVNQNQATTGQGVTTGAAKTIEEISEESNKKQEQQKDGQGEYDQSYIWFEEMAAFQLTPMGARQVASWSIPYQGKLKKPLEGDEFYKTIGRQDLAEEYNNRKVLRWTLMVGGIGLEMAGLIVGLTSIGNKSDECESYDYSNPNKCSYYKSDYTQLWIGMGVMGAGIVSFFIGMFTPAHPISAYEGRQLADQYNKKLKQRLGLSSSRQNRLTASAAWRFTLSSFSTNSGGGLNLSTRF